MGLRRLPRPRPTEKAIDLLYFQTTHHVYCDSVFADEKQRLYYAIGLNLSSVTACRAVSLFDTRCPINIQPDSSPAVYRKDKPADDESLSPSPCSQSEEALYNSGYKTNWSDKPGKLENDIASTTSSDSSPSDTESDINYISDCSSVTDDGYFTGNDKTDTILWRHVEFYIIRHPVPKCPNILAAIVTLLHTKREDRKPRL